MVALVVVPTLMLMLMLMLTLMLRPVVTRIGRSYCDCGVTALILARVRPVGPAIAPPPSSLEGTADLEDSPPTGRPLSTPSSWSADPGSARLVDGRTCHC